MFYQLFLKPFLFLFYPEKSHHIALSLFRFALNTPILSSILKKKYATKSFDAPVSSFGLSFKNRVGLAAGFDKDGKYIDLVSRLGFGFIEIGTVTPKPQAGNPLPRLFRLPKDKALINRMGFNNDGVDALVSRLKKASYDHVILGGNIGKNKVTPNDKAYLDYLICFEKLHAYVDYFVVNVSSPNTPGLRDLQEVKSLRKILTPLVQHSLQTNKKPILLKVAPDVSYDHLDGIIDLMMELSMDGLIISNTTIDRSNLSTNKDEVDKIGSGGVSGKPLLDSSSSMIQYVNKKTNGALEIIGVGGIHSGDDGLNKIKAGASLVQIYTGFIYEGPTLIGEIKKKLQNLSKG